MKLAFSVNSKQKKFFDKLAKLCDIKVYESKKVFNFSLKAFKYLKKVDFNDAVDLRVKDFYAKYELNLPKVLLKAFYNFLAYYNYFRYFAIIKKDYDALIVWNGFMFRQAIIIKIAKLYNIEIIYFENAALPKRIAIDKKGVNFYNSVPRDKEFFKQYQAKTLPKNLVERRARNPKKFKGEKKIELPKKYIFVPFQVDYDTQILLFSPWIKNMRELFFLCKEISQEMDFTFVFKEHPSSKKSYEDLKKLQNKNLIFANAHSTQQLIEKADIILTINSSVGIESLLFHKKVITLGKAFYNIEGIVKSVKDKKELLKALNGFEVDFDLVDNFLSYLYYDYYIEGDFKEFNTKRLKERLCL